MSNFGAFFFEAGDSVDGLYQAKWYSHDSLKSIPLGYWMWRADWKLKQLVHHSSYDDATGKREPLRPGATVPADWPDVFQGSRSSRRSMRAWIVCRSVTLRSIGENILVIHPDDVQMGVEERAQVFNQATGSLEDAREQPEPSPKVTLS